MTNIPLGAFYNVTAIGADENYISIVDTDGVENLLPTYPHRHNRIPFTGGFGDLSSALSPLHLDHLVLRNVTHIRATHEELIVGTLHHNFSWKVHVK